MEVYYKIENNFPQISSFKPDDTFLDGTKETVDGVDIFTPQELQDAINELATKEANEKAIAEAKVLKTELLNTITVEVNGKVFDGNETARNNMLASIQANQLLNIESTFWKLADNSVAEVTVEEIKEALALAIQRVGEIVTNG